MDTLRSTALLLLLTVGLETTGQQLLPGDKLPSYTFTEVLNYPTPHLRTDDLKGKAIILDGWTTYCAPCIKEMPYLDSLQKEFGDRLQIIAVAMEIKPSVDRLLDRLLSSGYLPYKLLPFPKDTLLFQKLVGPGTPLGQHTWIDQQGVIRYFSQGKELLSRRNIEKFLAGAPVPALDSFVAHRKEQNAAQEHPAQQAAAPAMGGPADPGIVSAYLAGWTPAMGHNIPTMISVHMPEQCIHVAGAPLSKLYYLAYGDTVAYYPVPVDGVSTSYGKLWLEPIITATRRSAFANGDSQRLYYYHQAAPDTITDARRLQAVMRASLSAAFGYHVTIETRAMPCWRLSVADAGKIPYDAKDAPPTDAGDEGAINFSGLGSSFLICKLYGAFPLEPPFIDATRITQKLHMNLAHDGNFAKLKAGLAVAGFRLTRTTTPMRVIVISD